MNTHEEVRLAPLDPADIPYLTRLMAATFDADVPSFEEVSPDLLQCYYTDDLFQKWPPGCIDAERFSVAVRDTLVGAVVIWHYPGDTSVLGLLFVAPEYQGYGIGAYIWRFLEERYDETARWLVAAPGWSSNTQRFYRYTCGFTPVRFEGAYVILEKAIMR